MSSNKELQNEEMYLPGGLGTIQCNGQSREIKSVFKGKDGATTITIGEKKMPLEIDGHVIKGLAVLFPERTLSITTNDKEEG